MLLLGIPESDFKAAGLLDTANLAKKLFEGESSPFPDLLYHVNGNELIAFWSTDDYIADCTIVEQDLYANITFIDGTSLDGDEAPTKSFLFTADQDMKELGIKIWTFIQDCIRDAR